MSDAIEKVRDIITILKPVKEHRPDHVLALIAGFEALDARYKALAPALERARKLEHAYNTMSKVTDQLEYAIRRCSHQLPCNNTGDLRSIVTKALDAYNALPEDDR